MRFTKTIDYALHAIDRRARAPSEIAWGALECGIWSDQSTITPGFLAITYGGVYDPEHTRVTHQMPMRRRDGPAKLAASAS